MKRCSTSVIIWKMQLKTTLSYHFTPDRRAVIKKSKDEFWRNWNSETLFVGMQNGTTAMKNSTELYPKIKNRATV